MDPLESIIVSNLAKIHELGIPEDDSSHSDSRLQLKSIESQLQQTRDLLRADGDKQRRALAADVAWQAENSIEMILLADERNRQTKPSQKSLMKFDQSTGGKSIVLADEDSGKREALKKRKKEVEERWKGLEEIKKELEGFKKRCEELGKEIDEEFNKRSEEVGTMTSSTSSFSPEIYLVRRLIEGDADLRVVSIVAQGGAGKTTLADRIYKRDDVKNYFGAATAWISVNENVRELLQDIAEQVMDKPKQDSANLDIKDLQETLSRFLKEKRYLIVLDDMWENGVWDGLEAAFPDAKNGSRILLTTRSMDVAMHADANPANPPHELPLLSPEESWELFLKKAFPQLQGEIASLMQLEEIGKQVVAKCMGLPLAIEVIGGLVAARGEGNVADWMHVLHNLNGQLSQESVDCSDMLAFCYYDLPNHLKPCFLYLGLFPKSRKIDVEKLMMLWVAEGFILSGEDQVKEDVVKDYFLELIGRSMIQVVEREWDGDVIICGIHDLLRELAISEATRHQFFAIDFRVSPSTSYSTRRLAIHNEINFGSLENCSTTEVRSLLCFTQSMSKFSGKSFMFLRVLDLEGINVQENMLDDVIGKHVHLKYLNLSGTSITRLPSSIDKLYSLETLLLDYNTYLPETVWNLHRLRHLHALDCEFEGQPQLHNLKNLHTLCLSAGNWIEENSLISLSSLRILKIAGDVGSHSKVLWSSIEKLVNLQSLVLSESSIAGDRILPSLNPYSHLYEMVLGGNLERLPDPEEFPKTLTRLILDRSGLEEDPMPTLEKLSNLQILQLSGNVYQGKKMILSAGGFPQLRCLTFLCLEELVEWTVEEGAMPKLVHLSISVCPNLNMLPEGLQYISTLREFETWEISMQLYDRLQESQGKDWSKIQHVPYLRICQ